MDANLSTRSRPSVLLKEGADDASECSSVEDSTHFEEDAASPSPLAPRRRDSLKGRISVFETKENASLLTAKEGSPVARKEKRRRRRPSNHYLGSQGKPSSSFDSKSSSASSPVQSRNGPAPNLDRPLRDAPSKRLQKVNSNEEADDLDNNVRGRMRMFEKKNRETRLSSRSKHASKDADEYGSPQLASKTAFKSKSTDWASFATPTENRVKLKKTSNGIAKLPVWSDDTAVSPRTSLRAFNRPEEFDSPSRFATKQRSWKPKSWKDPLKAASEHVRSTVYSSGPSLETLESDSFESPGIKSRRSYKPKRVSSLEDNESSTQSCADSTRTDLRESPRIKIKIKTKSKSKKDNDVSQLGPSKPGISDPCGIQEEVEATQKQRRSYKTKRIIPADGVYRGASGFDSPQSLSRKSITSLSSTSGHTAKDSVGHPEETDSASPQTRKSYKMKRIISTEEMKSQKPANTRKSEGNLKELRSSFEKSLKRSKGPKQIESQMSDQGKAEKKHLAAQPARHSKLQDRINMFNKISRSPEPQRAFLGSRQLKKLVQKEESTEDTHEAMLSALNAPNLEDTEQGPEQEQGKKKRVDGTAAGTASSTSDGKPKMSLDTAAKEKKRNEKKRNKSFVRRDEINAMKAKMKAAKSALVEQKDKDKNAVFAHPGFLDGDLAKHDIPDFPKDKIDRKIIITALRKNFVFQEMEEDDMNAMVNAMESIQVSKGEVIVKQGTLGGHFYVIAKGEVSVHVNGRKVATLGHSNAFGELALLYNSPRAATVTAEEQPTKLFQVDEKSFQIIMHSETKKSQEEKIELLLQVPFLSSLCTEDISRLCSVMEPVIFTTGDFIVQKGDKGSSFFIIRDGKVRVTDIFVGGTSYEDISLERGDYFGEDALISDEPRAANVVALTPGSAFSIDRENVRKVLGDFASLISKAQDRQKMESIKLFRDADLSSSDFDNLAKLVVDQRFDAGTCIFLREKNVEAALYIVREGTVRINYPDKDSEDIGGGGAFGQELLLAGATDKSNCNLVAPFSAFAVTACVCGKLTLEDCRTIFDTTALGDRIFCGGNAALDKRREEMRVLMQSRVKYEDLVKDRLLGEGQFGTVWLVRADPHKTGDKSKMIDFAMKVQFKEDPVRKDGAIEAIKREMTVVQQLKHPFIIDLVDKYETEDQIMMLTEPVKGGELWSRIHREEDDGNWVSGMRENDSKFYALVVADTLAYMHRQKIAFRDLKPENILIDGEGYPTLCDFGFAKYCPDQTYTFCGTPNYLAPEIVLNRGHGVAVDHWALGIVVYEMITGENPFYFEGQDHMELMQAIVQEDHYPLPDTVSGELIEFMNGLLEKDPVQRLGSLAGGEKGILKHAWFVELDINEVRNKQAKAPYIPDIK